MAPRILIFSIAMGTEHLSYVKFIATEVPTFFGNIISALTSVYTILSFIIIAHPFLLQSKGSDQINSGREKKSVTETRTTSSNSKKEDYKKNRHKSPEKSKNIDKRSDRSSHPKKSSTDSARSEKSHRDHHRHRWFIFGFLSQKDWLHVKICICAHYLQLKY